MKVIIDLIEAIRQEINNQGDFTLLAMLLRKDEVGAMELVGEKPISRMALLDDTLIFYVDIKERHVSIHPVLKMLGELSNEEMMFPLKVSVNNQSFDVVGFGKSEKDKKFVVFIENR